MHSVVLLPSPQYFWMSSVANEILLVLLVTTITAAVIAASSQKQPYHTSSLSGAGWLLELLEGHDNRIHTELGMHHEVFLCLVRDLRSISYKSSRDVSLEEQVGIFLYTCRTGLSVRHVGERFQRANGTVTK